MVGFFLVLRVLTKNGIGLKSIFSSMRNGTKPLVEKRGYCKQAELEGKRKCLRVEQA
jgi:hypothetical protein